MSTIPSSAMPHAYVHDDEKPERAPLTLPSPAVLAAGAVAVIYLIRRALR
jgi:hypothetical protein